MTTNQHLLEECAGTELAAAVPPPFFVDQRALRLPGEPDGQSGVAPSSALRALVAAAEGGLHVSTDVLNRLAGCAPGLHTLPASARRGLVSCLVSSQRPALKIDFVQRAGLLGALLPEVEALRTMPKGNGLYKDVYVHTLRVVDSTADDLITRLAALLHDIAKPETLSIEHGLAHFQNHDLVGAEKAKRRMRSLRFDREVVEGVEVLVRLHLRANSYEAGWTDSAVRRLKLDAGAHWNRLLNLSYADVTSARPEAVNRAHRRVEALEQHARALAVEADSPPLDGNQLMRQFGRGPGKWIGRVKQHLVGLVHAGELQDGDSAAAYEAAASFLATDEPD